MNRSSEYVTTNEFLEIFNLPNLQALPGYSEVEELAQDENFLDAISDVVTSGDKDKFYFDEVDELDKLSSEIKDVKVATDFTKLINAKNRENSAYDVLEFFVAADDAARENEFSLQATENADFTGFLSSLKSSLLDDL